MNTVGIARVADDDPVAPPAPVATGTSTGPAGDGLRADIQALRALAVGSVMLFHLWPHGLTGGYIGVDVFFVISGFLITSHLLAEIDATGALRPGRFWARRAKRLVPASALVLGLTAVAVVSWVPRYLWRQFLGEITASTVQVENWLLAHNSVDYLAAQNAPSPTQHFWTLSAEEQFYVALPVVLLLATGLARLVRVHHRRTILIALLLTVAGSVAYSIWLTATTPGVAYFSTFTRTWEFGGGALLAFASSSTRRHRMLPWVGVAGIVVACVSFGSKTPFPGIAAALPVVATALVIWSGRGSAFARVGELPPVALLGRVSYPAYLWHWPLIVLLPFAVHRPLNVTDKLAIIVATVLLAWLSTRFVEEPIRFRPRLLGARRPRTVAAWCGSAMALVIAFSVVTAHSQAVRDKHSAEAAKQVVAQMPRCLGAQSMDPKLAPCDNPDLAGMLLPDPAEAKNDDSNMGECWGMTDVGTARVCQLGPATGYRKRVFAVGDSHNNTLIGVYRQIAQDNNWRIDVAGNAGCYLTTAAQRQPSDVQVHGCNTWRASVIADAQQGGYDAIIVTHSDRDHLVVPPAGETEQQATVRGLVEAWHLLPDVPIVAIRDNPSMTPGTTQCVTTHLETAAVTCALPRSRALHMVDGQAEAVQQVHRAHLIDLTSLYCTDTVCPPVIGHVLVYRDASHITATYAATLAPYIERQVVAAFSH